MQYCKRQILSHNGTVNYKHFLHKIKGVEETEVLGKFTPLCFTFLKTPLLHYLVFTRKKKKKVLLQKN